jgi:cell division protein FtsB
VSSTPLRRPGFAVGIGPQIIVVALLVGLAGAMAIQPTRQLLAQRSRIEQMTEELKRVERSNERLEAYVVRLNDPDYLEQQARAQLGLVRPGETSYVVMPPQRRDEPRKHRGGGRDKPTPPGFIERVFDFIGVP